MRAVVFTGAGGNEVVRVEQRADPEPSGGEVMIAVRFAGLNPADLAQRSGRYPAPPGSPADVPGLELAGTVVATGKGVLGLQPGERVLGLVGGGGLADRVIAHERHLVGVPDTLGEREAAAVPEAFVTAHDALAQGGLRLGALVVVNGANGGVGTAAVQIAATAGARVLAVVRSEEVRAEVAKLGAEVFAPELAVEEARARGGADLVLELVGASSLEGDLRSLAPQGHIVVVGTGAGADATLDLRRLMARRATITGTGLRVRPLEQKAAALQAFAREVLPHLASGRMRPLVDTVFPASAAAAAFDRLEARGKLGKVLLDFEG